MKLTKQQWTMVIAGAVIVFLIYWFFFRKKKESKESGYMTWLGLPSTQLESAYGPMGGTYSHFGYETGYEGSGWGLTESNFRAATSGIRNCPAGQVPCGYSKTGCCPEGSTARKIEIPKNSTTQFPKTTTGSQQVKCPDGYIAFQVTTPGGVKWGCKHGGKIGTENWADPIKA